MIPPRFAPGLALWVAGSCLLAAWAQDELATQLLVQRPGPPSDSPCPGTEPSDPCWPHRKKSATLLPSFTKTTTPATSHHPKTTSHHPKTTTHHPKTTTHHSKTTTHHPTTHATNHTTHPANHTTPHPTHHTTPFHPTHPANHTTPHPANHTTAPINHTTPHPPTNHTTPPVITTAPSPTVPPLVAVGNYTVWNGSAICLRLEAGLQVQVQYTSKAKQLLRGVFAVQPNHTNASGACSSETATLHLCFPEGFLLFVFKKNETKGTSYLSRVQANLTYQFLQATETSFGADSSSLQEFEASLGHSYQCRNRTLALAGDFHLQVLNEHLQAFDLRGGKFGEAEVCLEQRRSLLVPIIVFVIIAVLVIIVLVAYAVGRRRSHMGYETI